MIVITRSLQELTLPHFLQKIEVIPTPTAMMLQHVVFHDVTTQHDATGMTTLIGPFFDVPIGPFFDVSISVATSSLAWNVPSHGSQVVGRNFLSGRRSHSNICETAKP